MSYAWIIDADAALDRVGTIGPHDAPEDLVAALNDGGGLRFRMGCDGESSPCYEGRLATHEPFASLTEHQAFGPLDDLGRPDAGCAWIAYLVNDEWREI